MTSEKDIAEFTIDYSGYNAIVIPKDGNWYAEEFEGSWDLFLDDGPNKPKLLATLGNLSCVLDYAKGIN